MSGHRFENLAGAASEGAAAGAKFDVMSLLKNISSVASGQGIQGGGGEKGGGGGDSGAHPNPVQAMLQKFHLDG